MNTYEQDAPALLAKLQPGTSWKIDYGKNNINTQVIHIRAIVDEDWVVFCAWSLGKQTWRYTVGSLYYFWLLDKDGRLKARRQRRARGASVIIVDQQGEQEQL